MAVRQAPGSGPGARQPGERREAVRNALIESRLTPNAISMTGFVLCIVSAVLVWNELWILGGVAYIVGSVCDTLDGRYSRMSGKGTLFGAFLDSTLDRIEEGVVLAAVAGYFAATGDDFAAAMCVIVVLGSLMVSYTRARAEALGLKGAVGIGSRAERVVVITAGLVLAPWGALQWAIYLLAATAWVTVLQRILHVRRQLAHGGSHGERP